MMDVIRKIEPFVSIIMNVYVHRCAGIVIATGYEDLAGAVAELNSSQCPRGLLNIIGVANYTISILMVKTILLWHSWCSQTPWFTVYKLLLLVILPITVYNSYSWVKLI